MLRLAEQVGRANLRINGLVGNDQRLGGTGEQVDPDTAEELAFRFRHKCIAIGSGLVAGSLLLMAFGIDSLIELASAAVLLWRLDVELRRGEVFAERAERTASRTGAVLLFALALYVAGSAGWKLWTRQGAEFSLPGLIVSIVAIPVMYILSRRKLRLADALGSGALGADAVESITCGWLALVVVVALAAQFAIGAWWLDPLASLGRLAPGP